MTLRGWAVLQAYAHGMVRTLVTKLGTRSAARRPHLIARTVLAGWILAASLFCGYVLVPQPHTYPLVVTCGTLAGQPACSPG